MKRIVVPRRIDSGTLPALLDALRAGERFEAGDDWVVDWANLAFADPAGLVLLAACCITAVARGVSLRFADFDPACYAARVRIQTICGLPDRYPHSRHTPRDRFTDVTRVSHAKEAAEFANSAVTILRLPEAVTLLSRYSLAEILGNVHDHTFSPCNAIAACQYYQKLGEVRYAVADTGGGIPGKVRMKVGPRTATDAIIEAAKPGFTTSNTRRGNFGLGLTVSREVACQSGGSLRVIAEDGLVTWTARGVTSTRVAWWPGTCVVGTIPAGSPVSLEQVLAGLIDS